MHDPDARVVGGEADDGPAGGGDGDGVALLRVDEVVIVEVAGALRQHEEVEAVEVHRVVLGAQDGRVLQHHLHRLVLPQRLHLGALGREHERPVGRRAVAGEVEHHRRPVGEVAREHAVRRSPHVRLQQRHRRGELEGDVVHAGRHGAQRPVAERLRRRARHDAQAERDQHPRVHVQRHRHRRRAVLQQPREAGVEPLGGGAVVERRLGRHQCRRGRRLL